MRRRWVLALPAAALLMAAGVGLAMKDKPEGKNDKSDGKATSGRKHRPLIDTAAFMKEHDENKDGFLTKDELPSWLQHNFARLDKNKDGKISKQELDDGAAFLLMRRRASDVLFVLVEMSDCDECCAEELERMYTALRKMDKNNDGKISTDELKAARAQILEERVDRLMKRLDKNKDGAISREEARGQVKAHFDELDENKDGKITRAELLAGAAARPADLKKDSAPRREK